MAGILRVALLTGVLLVPIPGRVSAAPASPDPTFGDAGFVLEPMSSVLYSGNDIAADPATGGAIAIFGGARVARYDAAGQRDLSFGGSGVVHLPVSSFSQGGKIVVQSDGRIVVAGYGNPVDEDIPFVGRLLADGTLDGSFGQGGVVEEPSLAPASVNAMAVQADGKILVGGRINYETAWLARYGTDGSLDSTFGTGGMLIPGIGDMVLGIVIQADGRIVTIDNDWTGGSIVLTRYGVDGTLDATFGSGGSVSTSVSPDGGRAYAAVGQPDDRIVVTGYARLPGNDRLLLLLLRYDADGALDASFDGDGIVTVDVGDDARGLDVRIRPGGGIAVCGWTAHPYVSPYVSEIVLAGFLADGSIDTAFGGVVTYPVFDEATAYGMDLTADGKLLVTGSWFERGRPGELPDRSGLVARFGSATAVCGDSIVEAPEDCDDKNLVDGDCCSSTCVFESLASPCAADADPCTLDECDGAGLCIHPIGNDGGPCDDGDVCTGVDTCDAGACIGSFEPNPTCKQPFVSSRGNFTVVDNAVIDARDRLVWRWVRGQQSDASARVVHTLCVYDQSALPQPVARLTTGATCGDQELPCWRPTNGAREIYFDRAAEHSGIRKVYIVPGDDAKSRAGLLGKGENLPLPPLPMSPPVTVQLHSELGKCWSSTFSEPRRNDAGRFRAVAD